MRDCRMKTGSEFSGQSLCHEPVTGELQVSYFTISYHILHGSGSGSAGLTVEGVEDVSSYYCMNVFWKINDSFGSNQSHRLTP
jgi:hypothetical protein